MAKQPTPPPPGAVKPDPPRGLGHGALVFFDHDDPAPWLDYEDNPIHAGDRIVHPSEEGGIVGYCPSGIREEDRWIVFYDGKRLGDPPSRLCLQVGDKGRGVVLSSSESAHRATSDGSGSGDIHIHLPPAPASKDYTLPSEYYDALAAWERACKWKAVRGIGIGGGKAPDAETVDAERGPGGDAFMRLALWRYSNPLDRGFSVEVPRTSLNTPFRVTVTLKVREITIATVTGRTLSDAVRGALRVALRVDHREG